MKESGTKMEFDIKQARRLLTKSFAGRSDTKAGPPKQIIAAYYDDLKKSTYIEDEGDLMLLLRFIDFILREAKPFLGTTPVNEDLRGVLGAIVPQDVDEKQKREYKKALGTLIKKNFKGNELLALIELMEEDLVTRFLIKVLTDLRGTQGRLEDKFTSRENKEIEKLVDFAKTMWTRIGPSKNEETTQEMIDKLNTELTSAAQDSRQFPNLAAWWKSATESKRTLVIKLVFDNIKAYIGGKKTKYEVSKIKGY